MIKNQTKVELARISCRFERKAVEKLKGYVLGDEKKQWKRLKRILNIQKREMKRFVSDYDNFKLLENKTKNKSRE